MTKPQAESFQVTQEKVELFKNLLASFWAAHFRRAWKSGFDAGRNSVDIIPIAPIVKPRKKISKAKPRKRELVIGRGTKLCNKCFRVEVNCRCPLWRKSKGLHQKAKTVKGAK